MGGGGGTPPEPTTYTIDGPDAYRLDYLASDPDTYVDAPLLINNTWNRAITVSSPSVADTVIPSGQSATVPVRITLSLAHATDEYSVARTLTWTDGVGGSGSWNVTATGLAVPYIAHVMRGSSQSRPSGNRYLLDAAGNLHFSNGAAGTGVTVEAPPPGLTWAGSTEAVSDVLPLAQSMLVCRFPRVNSGSSVESLVRSLDSDDNARVSYRGWRPANIPGLPTRLRNKFDLQTWWRFRGPALLADYGPQTTSNGIVVFRDWQDPNRIAAIMDNVVITSGDGGLTWTRRTVSHGMNSPDRGIIRGSLWLIGTAATGPVLVRSTDGGFTFASVTPSYSIAGYQLARRAKSGNNRPLPCWDPVSARIGWPLEPSGSNLLFPGQTATPLPPAIGWSTDGVAWTVEPVAAVYNASPITNPNPFPIGLPYDQIGNIWCHANGDRYWSLQNSANAAQNTIRKNEATIGTFTTQLQEMWASVKGSVLGMFSGSIEQQYRGGAWFAISPATVFGENGHTQSFIIADGVW